MPLLCLIELFEEADMRTGRPVKPLVLKPEDRQKLEMLARRPKTAQRLSVRSKIVLRAAEGLRNQEIARQLEITGATVGKWRGTVRRPAFDGIVCEARPVAGRPPHALTLD